MKLLYIDSIVIFIQRDRHIYIYVSSIKMMNESIYIYIYNIIHIYSGITSGRVLNGELFIYIYSVGLHWSTAVGRVLDLVGAFTR